MDGIVDDSEIGRHVPDVSLELLGGGCDVAAV
jgi:hypothetical protein